MNINQTENENLYKGLGIFLEAFRSYIIALMMEKSGEGWAAEITESFSEQQKDTWDRNIENGISPESQIDYHHFKYFAIKNKTLLRRDFGKEVNNLPSRLDDIADVRNKIAHYDPIDQDEATKAWIQMKEIARILKMDELEAEIVKLREGKTEEKKVESATKNASGTATAMPWFRVVTPHLDIKQGNLDESVFAANLSEVALGVGREIYGNSALFFSKTFFTSGLKNIARTVIKGLNGKEDAENRVISLQTGFGGGKTHTLISLYHLCKMGVKAAGSNEVSELVAFAGKPEFEQANIAVFTNTTNDPANGRIAADGTHIQTIWGELAYQIGGAEAFEIIRKNDEQMIAPAGLFKQVLEKSKPALILIDELADYCVKASARQVVGSTLSDQTISFMQELTQAVSDTNNCVLIVTLPASPQEVGNTAQAQQILHSLENRVRRIGADTKPVADEEIYEVIRRRLFDDIGDAAFVEAAVSEFMRTFQENWTELPDYSTRAEYRAKLLKSYPFHPELIDVFRIRWASKHGFQRTRGVLRLLAAIVSDLWQRKNNLVGNSLLISAGDANFSNVDALAGQLKTLFGNGYDAVMTADVSGTASNASKIDNNKSQYGNWNLTQGIASVVLLNSFGSDGANRGVSIKDLKLNLLQPNGFNLNDINGALGELESSAHYLHYAKAGAERRYWFHTEPNLNILINQAKSEINTKDVEAEILKRVNDKSRNIQDFKILVNPSGDVPEQNELTLVILHPSHRIENEKPNKDTEKYIKEIATKKGNSERIYRNTMLFLGLSEIGQVTLVNSVKEYLACKKISEEYNSQIERDQKEDLRGKIAESDKQAESALVNAYSVALKYSVQNGTSVLSLKEFHTQFDGQINNNLTKALKDEEWLLESVGLGTLRNNNLLPTIENPVKVKDVYEAFIRFDDKPMITSSEAIKKSLQKYCFEGQFCIAAGSDGKEFTKYYLKENVPFLDVNDATYWIIDKSLKAQPEPVTPPSNGGDAKNPPIIEPPIVDPLEAKKEFESITVSGNLPLDQFTASFGYFIAPFTMNGNKVEIQVSFKIKSSESNQLTESNPQYKSAKEAAKQLGLQFDEKLK